MKASALAVSIVTHCAIEASRSVDGTFFLSSVILRMEVDMDRNTLYGYSGNPGLVGVFKTHGLMLHDAFTGRFAMVPGWEHRILALV